MANNPHREFSRNLLLTLNYLICDMELIVLPIFSIGLYLSNTFVNIVAPKVLGSVSIIYELGSIQHNIYGHWDIGKNRGDPPSLIKL